MTRSLHRLAVGMIAAWTLLLGLTGCALLFGPPTELVGEARSLASEVRDLDGVKDAEVDVYSRDIKDHPSDYIFSFVINAKNSTGLDTLPSAVGAILAKATAYGVRVQLVIPARIGQAEVDLRTLGEETVSAAPVLRELPQAESVRVGDDYTAGSSIVLKPSARLTDLTAGLRSIEGFGQEGPLVAASVEWRGAQVEISRWVDVGVALPSSEVLDALEQLGDEASVTRIYAQEADTANFLGATRIAGRAVIDVNADADAAKPVVDLLTATFDSAAEAGLTPRTAFGVTSASGTEVRGYVGLPVGSPEPDDIPDPPEPTPDPSAPNGESRQGSVVPEPEWTPSTDPAVLAQLDLYSADVIVFLENTERTAGVSAEYAIAQEDCPRGSGTSMRGSIVLPIFEVTDSADEAFAAITNDWTESGMRHSDRALGLDFWSTQLLDATVTAATIRGTNEGISITANSACV